MARTIEILPDVVANQIAAGEVVERPASVVKELVENALDAAAKRILVEIEGGGKRLVRVTDDGSGMSREDALLSLDRHATSKIREAEDLRRVATFGFRGEALPSLAAVSRLTIETRAEGEEVGTAVRSEGGRIVDVQDHPRRRGTTVEARTLFYNAPARRKFLRTNRVESRAVADALVDLALANPSVGFRLESDGRTLQELSETTDVRRRIASLWGEDEASTLVPASGESSGYELRGLVQRPDAARPGLRRAHLFVNGRPFRDKKLVAAVDEAYRTTIPSGHRPWLFLYLEARGGSVDVNVHPTKAEVRFHDLAVVEELVRDAVRRALEGAESAATFDRRPEGKPLQVRERWRGSREERGADAGREAGRGRGSIPGRGGRVPTDQMALFVPVGAGKGAARPIEGEEGPDVGADAGSETGPEEAERPAEGRIRLWQIHDAYILAESRDGLLIIDQHSAHERVLFERLMRSFADEGQEGQGLLFPLTIRLAAAEYAVVEDLLGILQRIGFEVEGFGGDSVLVRAVPNPHPYFDAERCFREMIAELTEGSSELVRAARNQHERIAMTFACKGAIKAGQRLSEEEMRELVDALFATELPYHDVHGRPTVIRLSRAELERKLGRH